MGTGAPRRWGRSSVVQSVGVCPRHQSELGLRQDTGHPRAIQKGRKVGLKYLDLGVLGTSTPCFFFFHEYQQGGKKSCGREGTGEAEGL